MDLRAAGLPGTTPLIVTAIGRPPFPVTKIEGATPCRLHPPFWHHTIPDIQQGSSQISGVLFDDLFAVVIAAIAAKTMRTLVFAAIRAFYERRSLDLPDIVPSFVPRALECFLLGTIATVSTSFNLLEAYSITSDSTVPAPRDGDRGLRLAAAQALVLILAAVGAQAPAVLAAKDL